VYYTLLK